MKKIIGRGALAAAILGSTMSFAIAQAGPVDGKGQGGGTAHRGVVEPSGSKDGNVASGNYTDAIRNQQSGGTQGGSMEGGSMGSTSGTAAQPGGADPQSSTGSMR